jgi:hypothetical protein
MSSSLIYTGDSNWFDTNSLLSDTIALVLGFLTFLEFGRGVIHGLFPYEGLRDVSGMTDALSLEGVNEDAVALMMSMWGLASIILSSAYLMPFIFGD